MHRCGGFQTFWLVIPESGIICFSEDKQSNGFLWVAEKPTRTSPQSQLRVAWTCMSSNLIGRLYSCQETHMKQNQNQKQNDDLSLANSFKLEPFAYKINMKWYHRCHISCFQACTELQAFPPESTVVVCENAVCSGHFTSDHFHWRLLTSCSAAYVFDSRPPETVMWGIEP